jgi:hypothetical protein
VGQRFGEGVLLVRDIGPAHGRAHFYGPALTRDPAALCERWCALTGASPENAQRRGITGWRAEGYTAFGNVGSVLGYTFKPWPREYGRRSLPGDVLAAGVMAAPWMAARAILLGSPPSLTKEPGKASGKRRKCQRCGAVFQVHRRSHSKWCSNTCKSRNWEERHPGRHRSGPTTPGSPPEDAG